MGFKVQQQYEYEWPVDVNVPDAKRPGKFDVQRFIGLFKIEPVDKAESRLKQLQENGSNEFVESLIGEVWLGWRDGQITDDADSPIANTPENRAMVANWPMVRAALMKAYTDANSGNAAKARQAKN